MDRVKKIFSSKLNILALFTIISTLLAIPLIILVTQEKQSTRQFAAEKQNEAVKGTMTGPLSGYVYLDSNYNGQRDFEEKPYPNASVRVYTKLNNAYTARELKTDSYGYFLYRFENQTSGIQLKLVLPDGYRTSTPNPVTVLNTQKQIVEFGVTGNALITPKPTCIPRPACLDSVPRCLIAEPAKGWCPKISVYPTKPVRTEPTVYPKPTYYTKPAVNVSPYVK